MKETKLFFANGRKFRSDLILKKFLSKLSSESRARYTIQIFTLSQEMKGSYIENEILSNKRDLQMKSILEDSQLPETIGKIVDKVEKAIGANDPKKQGSYNRHPLTYFKSEIDLVENEKDLNDLVNKYGANLFEIEADQDWYVTLLKIRNFRKLPVSYRYRKDSEYFKQNSQIFLAAQNQIRKERKNKK